jgi:hypothetical protein
MWSIFCDDVRQEIGNKLSYLGIYGPVLIVESIPTNLVKLCCVMSVRVPAESPPRKVTFRLLRGDEVIFEADAVQSEQPDPAASTAVVGTDSIALTISTVAQLVSFPLTQHCLLRSIAVVDGMELRGGSLELMSTNTKH